MTSAMKSWVIETPFIICPGGFGANIPCLSWGDLGCSCRLRHRLPVTCNRRGRRGSSYLAVASLGWEKEDRWHRPRSLTEQMTSGIDEPERSGTPFRYLLFSRNARSGTYCQISRNAFYFPALIYNGRRWWLWIYDAPLFYLLTASQ